MVSLSDLTKVYGPWAVITGASSGMGAEFARKLASAGMSLVLIARRVEKMETLCSEISAANPEISIKIIGVDLTSETAIETITEGVSGLDIGLVINNAGVEVAGPFLKIDRSAHDKLIALNVVAFTQISHFFGRLLVARNRATVGKRAGMIMISSMVSSPIPYFNSYSASKSYVTTLGLCLRTEWAPERIDVSVIEPGVVVTEMKDRIDEDVTIEKAGFEPMAVEKFVPICINEFLNGKGRFTPGLKNRITQFITSFIPEKYLIPLMGSSMQKAFKPGMLTYNVSDK